MQSRGTLLLGLRFELLANTRVGGRAVEQAVEQRLEVQRSAADE